jgi:hypothetical protein
LHASTLIAIWQRLLSWNISWDFDVLSKVIRKRGIFSVVVLSADDRRVVDTCLSLITSKSGFANTSEMSPAGVETGRCCIQILYRLLRFEIEGEALEVRADG